MFFSFSFSLCYWMCFYCAGRRRVSSGNLFEGRRCMSRKKSDRKKEVDWKIIKKSSTNKKSDFSAEVSATGRGKLRNDSNVSRDRREWLFIKQRAMEDSILPHAHQMPYWLHWRRSPNFRRKIIPTKSNSSSPVPCQGKARYTFANRAIIRARPVDLSLSPRDVGT